MYIYSISFHQFFILFIYLYLFYLLFDLHFILTTLVFLYFLYLCFSFSYVTVFEPFFSLSNITTINDFFICKLKIIILEFNINNIN